MQAAHIYIAYVIIILLQPCLLTQSKAIEISDEKIDVIIKSERSQEGVVTTTKRFYRNGLEVMCIQKLERPTLETVSFLYVRHEGVRASMQLQNGKLPVNITIEPGLFVVSINDKNKDGVWDEILIMDDDMNLLQAYRRTPDDLLFPLTTLELKKLTQGKSGNEQQPSNKN